jgi:hypothetical protein
MYKVVILICFVCFYQGCSRKNNPPKKVYFQKVYSLGEERKEVVIYIENYSIRFSKIMNEKLIELAECYFSKNNSESSMIWGITFINSLKPFNGSPWWHDNIDWEELSESTILSVIYEVRKKENLFEIKKINYKKGFRKYNLQTITKRIEDDFCDKRVGTEFIQFRIPEQDAVLKDNDYPDID